MAIEYDGRWHETPKQRAIDLARRQSLEAKGWIFVIITADQLATDYAGILNQVRVARQTQAARRATATC